MNDKKYVVRRDGQFFVGRQKMTNHIAEMFEYSMQNAVRLTKVEADKEINDNPTWELVEIIYDDPDGAYTHHD